VCTFSTTLDHTKRPEEQKNKSKGKGKMKNNQNKSEKSRGKKKEQKCFICDEPGLYANKSSKKKKQADQESDAEESKSEDRHGHVMWGASMFVFMIMSRTLRRTASSCTLRCYLSSRCKFCTS
jgi:hypothetical protein